MSDNQQQDPAVQPDPEAEETPTGDQPPAEETAAETAATTEEGAAEEQASEEAPTDDAPAEESGDDEPSDEDDADQDDDEDDQDEEEDEDEDEEEDDEEEEDEDDDHGHHREEWEHGAAPDDSTVVEYQRRDAEALFLSGRPCSDPSCQNYANSAEDAWIKLVSAIPCAGQVSGLTVVTAGTPAPSQEDIQSLVNEVRPDTPDRYALKVVSEHWQAFKDGFDTDPGTSISAWMKSGLRTLSEHWKGDDFDAFAEQVEVVLANCAAICDDIGDASTGAVGLLEQKADEFYALQGGDSGELPYPAPMYWIPNPDMMYTDPMAHVRPPFTNGDCYVISGCDQGGEYVRSLMSIAGFNMDYVDEVSDYVEAQTEYYIAQGKNKDPKTTPEQARIWAEADANQNITADVSAGLDDYEQRSQIANEDVVNRWENAEESAGSFTPEAQPSNASTFRSASDMLADSYEGLDSGANALESGDEPPGAGGAGGGLEPPGGTSGGLASGGPATLGGGGSFPVGAASSTGEGAGGGAGGGSGAGGGRGGGMGGGMMGGMGAGGGGRGMNGEQPADGEHSDWLEEDQEIWGILDIDVDPYA